MSRHEGVNCDACFKSNFRIRRYKCLICYDYDLCGPCFDKKCESNNHKCNHPMQCILTKNDYNIFYDNEAVNENYPCSFTCPQCGDGGFSDKTLIDHVTQNCNKKLYGLKVICPICAGAYQSQQPNRQTTDLAGHLNKDHKVGSTGPTVVNSQRSDNMNLSTSVQEPLTMSEENRYNSSSGSAGLSRAFRRARMFTSNSNQSNAREIIQQPNSSSARNDRASELMQNLSDSDRIKSRFAELERQISHTRERLSSLLSIRSITKKPNIVTTTTTSSSSTVPVIRATLSSDVKPSVATSDSRSSSTLTSGQVRKPTYEQTAIVADDDFTDVEDPEDAVEDETEEINANESEFDLVQLLMSNDSSAHASNANALSSASGNERRPLDHVDREYYLSQLSSELRLLASPETLESIIDISDSSNLPFPWEALHDGVLSRLLSRDPAHIREIICAQQAGGGNIWRLGRYHNEHQTESEKKETAVSQESVDLHTILNAENLMENDFHRNFVRLVRKFQENYHQSSSDMESNATPFRPSNYESSSCRQDEVKRLTMAQELITLTLLMPEEDIS